MEELVNKAKKGDIDAYTNLILLIRNDLYKICKTRIFDDNDIEDIIQDTMIQTFKKIKFLKNSQKFKSWIIKILINNCNNYYRIKSRNKEIDFNYSYYKELSQNNIDIVDDDINFYQLLSILEYEERIIIILYYSERFTLKEISKILKINENTIKTKIRRAKDKIKEDIEGGIQVG